MRNREKSRKSGVPRWQLGQQLLPFCICIFDMCVCICIFMCMFMYLSKGALRKVLHISRWQPCGWRGSSCRDQLLATETSHNSSSYATRFFPAISIHPDQTKTFRLRVGCDITCCWQLHNWTRLSVVHFNLNPPRIHLSHYWPATLVTTLDNLETPISIILVEKHIGLDFHPHLPSNLKSKCHHMLRSTSFT